MEINIRCTQVGILPSDPSGFLVRAEVADAEDLREQVLGSPNDGADDWPLGKRYTEVCARLERAVSMLRLCLNDAEIGLEQQEEAQEAGRIQAHILKLGLLLNEIAPV